MTKRIRIEPTLRVREILDAALPLARKHGYDRITRAMIAERAQCSASLITAHMGSMPAVRRCIMREAIRVSDLVIVLQMIAARDPMARKVPVEMRRAALASWL